MRLITLILTLLLTSAALAQNNTLSEKEKADGYTLLFDGKTLDGWTTSAELAAWGIEQDTDGSAVLTMLKPGKGWWLRTTKMYRDFDLFVDFDVPKGSNSGVGLRSSSVGDPAFTGMEIQIFGNQGEKPTITSCGAVYDAITPDCSDLTGATGGLSTGGSPPFAPGILPLRDGGQWNTYHITLVGDTLNIWLNGVHIHKDQKLDTRGYTHKPDAKNALNTRCPTGYIALQDHGDKVRFRNIKIKDLSKDKDPGGFEPIFDGKDTKGWRPLAADKDANRWSVEDGVLMGEKGVLGTERTWKNPEYRFFFRGTKGAEFQSRPAFADAPARFTGDGSWHDCRLRAEGPKVQVWLDGVLLSDSPSRKNDDAGQLLLATRGGVLEVKDVQARELPNK